MTVSGYREILLHAGMSKTGSTSIQANCRRHAGLLSRHGVHYPQFQFGGGELANHSIPLVVAASDDPGRYALGLRRRFGADVEALIAHCRGELRSVLADGGEILLLSSERVAGLSERDLAALRAILRPAAGRLRVLLYLRDPVELLASTLQERTKAGAEVDPRALVGRARRRFSALRQVFPAELEPVDFHRACRAGGGLVADFFRRLGLPAAALAGLDLSVENRRISTEAYLLMREINRSLPKGSVASRRRPGDLQPLEALPGAFLRLSDVAESEICAAAREEGDWLRRETGLALAAAAAGPRESPWEESCLQALPGCVEALEIPGARQVVAEFLAREALERRGEQPQLAAALHRISSDLAAP